MAVDYYGEAQQIVSALKSEGLCSEAEAVRAVLEAGSTATEILMGVRWHLQQILRANQTTDLTTKLRIRRLVEELDKVLS
jgi:hypothetical protein